MISFFIISGYTVAIIYIYFNNRKLTIIDPKKIIKEINEDNSITVDKKAEVICMIEKTYRADLHWFEKAISTIGVVAFFSMTVAISLQSFSLSSHKQELELVKKEKDIINDKIKEFNPFVKSYSQLICRRYMKTGKITDHEKEILEYRLNQLEENEISGAALYEIFQITFVDKKFERITIHLENNWDLLDKFHPTDKISLAQYYFSNGAKMRSNDILSNLDSHINNMPETWRFKYYVLFSAVNNDYSTYLLDISLILRLSKEEALKRLKKEVLLLENSDD